jgi:hypothetical protein
MRSGPGLAKVRTIPLTRRREKLLVAIADGPMRDWLERADIVSEGAVQEGAQPSYFGTTSIVLPWDAAENTKNATALERGALALDPHLRVRALRIARREAEMRAPGALASIRAEIEIALTTRGITLCIDVEAKVATRRKRTADTRE